MVSGDLFGIHDRVQKVCIYYMVYAHSYGLHDRIEKVSIYYTVHGDLFGMDDQMQIVYSMKFLEIFTSPSDKNSMSVGDLKTICGMKKRN
jgi:hypothetical protein